MPGVSWLQMTRAALRNGPAGSEAVATLVFSSFSGCGGTCAQGLCSIMRPRSPWREDEVRGFAQARSFFRWKCVLYMLSKHHHSLGNSLDGS